jgi:hypothetical protein
MYNAKAVVQLSLPSSENLCPYPHPGPSCLYNCPSQIMLSSAITRRNEHPPWDTCTHWESRPALFSAPFPMVHYGACDLVELNYLGFLCELCTFPLQLLLGPPFVTCLSPNSLSRCPPMFFQEQVPPGLRSFSPSCTLQS